MMQLDLLLLIKTVQNDKKDLLQAFFIVSFIESYRFYHFKTH